MLTLETLGLSSQIGKWGHLTELWLFLASLTTMEWNENLGRSRLSSAWRKHDVNFTQLSFETDSKPLSGDQRHWQGVRALLGSHTGQPSAGNCWGLVKCRWPDPPAGSLIQWV